MNTSPSSTCYSFIQTILSIWLGLLGYGIAKEPDAPKAPKKSESDVAVAAGALQDKLPEANKLLEVGKWTEANDLLNSIHPEANRTPAQQQALASTMYHFHPELSYKLHKAVAIARPEQELPNYLWAVEQHRVGEWKGALESYKAASKLNPAYAPSYGLAAECALQLGLVEEAALLWVKSEMAELGTVEEFETELCKVHGPKQPYRQREELIKKARDGDATSAVALVAMDLEWPQDWWNGGPNEKFLKYDLKVIEELGAKENREITFARLAARLATLEPTDKTAKGLIEREGLLGSKPELPNNGRILSYLVTYIESHKFASKSNLTSNWAPSLEILAKTSKDPELHNARAWLHLDHPALPEIDLKGWEMTKDARFAASYLGGQMESGKLKASSPELIKAVTEFPDSSFIQNLALHFTKDGTKEHEAALIALIKADFAHLPRAGMLGRASATPLRAAFTHLVEIVNPSGAH